MNESPGVLPLLTDLPTLVLQRVGGTIAEPDLYGPAKERALENIFLKKSRDRRRQAGTF